MWLRLDESMAAVIEHYRPFGLVELTGRPARDRSRDSEPIPAPTLAEVRIGISKHRSGGFLIRAGISSEMFLTLVRIRGSSFFSEPEGFGSMREAAGCRAAALGVRLPYSRLLGQGSGSVSGI